MRRNRKSRKYGLVASSDRQELAPLDRDYDDDDDVTLYEAGGRK